MVYMLSAVLIVSPQTAASTPNGWTKEIMTMQTLGERLSAFYRRIAEEDR